MTKPEMQLIIERNKNKTLNCADIFSHDNIFHYPSNLILFFFVFVFVYNLLIQAQSGGIFVLFYQSSNQRKELRCLHYYTTEPTRPDLYTCLSASGINANISLTLQIKVSRTLYTNRIH